MSDQDKQEASELAKRAGTQGRHAVKNTGRAARKAASAATDVVVDEARDEAQKLEETLEDVVDTVRRINPKALTDMAVETGIGLLCLAFSVYAGSGAINQFRTAASRRHQIVVTRPKS